MRPTNLFMPMTINTDSGGFAGLGAKPAGEFFGLGCNAGQRQSGWTENRRSAYRWESGGTSPRL